MAGDCYLEADVLYPVHFMLANLVMLLYPSVGFSSSTLSVHSSGQRLSFCVT